MPTLDDIEAATPRCFATVGVKPAPTRECGRYLRSHFEAQDWRCSTHGPVLTWVDAGRRVRRFAGLVVYEDAEAA